MKNLPDTKNNKEIDILADVINDLGETDPKYQISPEHLKSYFTPFALRAYPQSFWLFQKALFHKLELASRAMMLKHHFALQPIPSCKI